MKFLSLLVALLLEQLRPLRREHVLHRVFLRYAALLERQLNGGEFRHGAIAWVLAVLPAVALAAAGFYALRGLNVLLALAWSAGVLYLTMGFRHFSHFFAQIEQALRAGDVAAARGTLGRWIGGQEVAEPEAAASEIARRAIEEGLFASHRQVFGTIAWFLLLGAAGAVLYRASALLAEGWNERGGPELAEFGRFAKRLFDWLDWVPARLTAASFAVAGNFEDAVECWRARASEWGAGARGVVLAAGAGALGVRLGEPPPAAGPEARAVAAAEPDAFAMESAVGLVWRSLVLWMFLVLIVSVAYALG